MVISKCVPYITNSGPKCLIGRKKIMSGAYGKIFGAKLYLGYSGNSEK